ncbi:protein of unknown function [Pseudomonas mediterranea]
MPRYWETSPWSPPCCPAIITMAGCSWRANAGKWHARRRYGLDRRCVSSLARACCWKWPPLIHKEHEMGMQIGFVMLLLLLIALAASTFRILREYERAVVFQLGRFWQVKGPGLILLIPVVQQMIRVDLRTIVLDVPPGRDHPGQRFGEGQCGAVFPRTRPAEGNHPGRELPHGDQPVGPDHLARRARQTRLGPTTGRARAIEWRYPAGAGCPDRRLGHQGGERRNQACGPQRIDDPCHRPASRGRT